MCRLFNVRVRLKKESFFLTSKMPSVILISDSFRSKIDAQ